jgi:hypothetical protein
VIINNNIIKLKDIQLVCDSFLSLLKLKLNHEKGIINPYTIPFINFYGYKSGLNLKHTNIKTYYKINLYNKEKKSEFEIICCSKTFIISSFTIFNYEDRYTILTFEYPDKINIEKHSPDINTDLLIVGSWHELIKNIEIINKLDDF